MNNQDPIIAGINAHRDAKAKPFRAALEAGVEGLSPVSASAQTCEQRRAARYGIDPGPRPLDYPDPTHFNAATCEQESPADKARRLRDLIESRTTELEAALHVAADAHHVFEQNMRDGLDNPTWSDPNWQRWYADHIVRVQRVFLSE
jgi:hypothetical protein